MESFDLISGGVDVIEELAKFNAWTPAISQGDFLSDIEPGTSATSEVTIDPEEWALTPAKGVMVVTLDDRAGRDEADLIPFSLR